MEQQDMQSPRSVLILNFGLHLIKAIAIERLKSVFDKFLHLVTMIKKKLVRNSPLFYLEDSSSWNSRLYKCQKVYDDTGIIIISMPRIYMRHC